MKFLNARFFDQCLMQHSFKTLAHARIIGENWCQGSPSHHSVTMLNLDQISSYALHNNDKKLLIYQSVIF